MLRRVAPAGTPITVRDLFAAARAGLSFGDPAEGVRAALESRVPVRYAFLTSTGRAGLTIVLKALSRLAANSRTEVVLPSYTCYSVAASVIKAGLRPRLVDVSAATLDYVPSELAGTDFSRVLAIVATNLYGLPNDLPALARTAKAARVFLIDDAAQAFGASVGGRPCGTWGDAGLYSLDRGKNVSAVEGGIVVTHSPEVADAVEREIAGLRSPGLLAASAAAAKALAYSMFLRPTLYWIPSMIPQLELGKTVFDTAFPLGRPTRPLVALASTMIGRLDEVTEARRANAGVLSKRLHDLPDLLFPHGALHSQPVYLRYPVLLPDRSMRDAAVAALNQVGIGATVSYPLSLGDVPELRGRVALGPGGLDGGRSVAARILTLPTHPFVTARDLEVAASILQSSLQRSSARSLRALVAGANL